MRTVPPSLKEAVSANADVMAPAVMLNFPTGYRWPLPVVIREAIKATGRKAGTVEVADYGTVVIEQDGDDLRWEYTPHDKRMRKEHGTWQR